MIPTRPELEEYARLLDEHAELKFRLDVAKIAYDELVARCLREGSRRRAKTREYDYIKVIGNTSEDERQLEEFRREIANINKAFNRIQGKLRLWEAHKDLYRSDVFHDGRAA